VRGLKLIDENNIIIAGQSHSARSAWIETIWPRQINRRNVVALRKECVD